MVALVRPSALKKAQHMGVEPPFESAKASKHKYCQVYKQAPTALTRLLARRSFIPLNKFDMKKVMTE